VGRILTAKQARAIFGSLRSVKGLAKYYGVSEGSIRNIQARRTWAEETAPRLPKARKSKSGVKYLYFDGDGLYTVRVRGVYLGQFSTKPTAERAIEAYLKLYPTQRRAKK